MNLEKNSDLFFDPWIPEYSALMMRAKALEEGFPFLRVGTLGNSVLGRPIPLLSIGTGERKCLYVATHHAMEWITTLLLMRFTNDFCTACMQNTTVGGITPKQLLNTHTLLIVPMLNPDGTDYQLNGIAANNPLRERLLKMNGSADFSHWQANARGVDLNHNYDAGFWEYKNLEKENGIEGGASTRYSGEAPESEPETAALCNLIRISVPMGGVLSLHTQGEEIYCNTSKASPKQTGSIARCLSHHTGYRLARANGSAAYGGLADWCLQKMSIPAFTLECGLGCNPLPMESLSKIYCRLRQALFLFPTFL